MRKLFMTAVAVLQLGQPLTALAVILPPSVAPRTVTHISRL